MRGHLIQLVALALPLSASALNVLDWILPSSSPAVSVSSEVVPHKIAIIGAGAAGSSAAFWAAKAKARSNVALEIDVFDRADYVGGRSTVVFPHGNQSLDPVELGASIFVEANKNLWRATQEFNLTRLSFDDDDGTTGFWDGHQFVFIMDEGKGIWKWLDTIKALWRYGYKSPATTQALTKKMIEKFVSLYSPASPSWTNISELATNMDWEDLISQSSAEYLDSQGISQLFSREIVESATRVNYGQNLDKIHALEGFCSMAASGASSVKGGNFKIFEQFLAQSGANLFLNTSVLSITGKQDHWSIATSNGKTKSYNDVIIAAPYYSTDIKITGSNDVPTIKEIPIQPYVHLHVTLLTTTAPHPNPEYFGLKHNAKAPTSILTTYEGVRHGGHEPEFNSLTYHGKIASDQDEFVVKIFSKEALSDEWLDNVFSNKVTWVLRKEWDAYPELPPTTSFPPVVLADGLYYANAFEPFISTMETETISSRNIVDQIFRKRFNSDICGRDLLNAQEKSDPVIILEDDVKQFVLTNDTEVLSETAEPIPEEPVNTDDFVLGWDCP
ncbi:FAD NAD(P)-binding domain-containing [Pyrrhoderma noxium]|uniref:FAD NAD(P)-binding domain-containing n=1 Tax=Pyrrhoderma noxium TaxID=2282107 RepID=A0A286URK2_9AGAM|nr:FAD NAD(P)-binding domain-containing [Pyrrhoderma noxium]